MPSALAGSVVVKPPPPFEGNNPPTFIRFRSHNGSIHIRQGGSRISIVTDACNNVIEDGATLTVVSPDPSALPVSGWSGPKDGEFRLALRIAENAPIGDAGQIRAKLKSQGWFSVGNTCRLDHRSSPHSRWPGRHAISAQL